MKWCFQEILKKTQYLTLDLGAEVMTGTGEIKTVIKFKYIGSILERNNKTTLETENE
jgi:hypothetical protein